MKKATSILLSFVMLAICTVPVFAATDDEIAVETSRYSSSVKGNGYFKIPNVPKIPDISNSVSTNINKLNINWDKIVKDTIKIDYSKIDWSKVKLPNIDWE